MKGFFKRLLIFFLTFLATCGLVSADRACSEMSARQEIIGMELRRVDETEVEINCFGKAMVIDTELLAQQARQIEKNWESIKDKVDLP